jgi:hypothetical protein
MCSTLRSTNAMTPMAATMIKVKVIRRDVWLVAETPQLLPH